MQNSDRDKALSQMNPVSRFIYKANYAVKQSDKTLRMVVNRCRSCIRNIKRCYLSSLIN